MVDEHLLSGQALATSRQLKVVTAGVGHPMFDMWGRHGLASGCPLDGTVGRLITGTIPGLRTLQCGDFDFDLHAWVRQTSRDHHGCRTHLSEVLAQYGPALLKLGAIR
jgi:hypothetical protein